MGFLLSAIASGVIGVIAGVLLQEPISALFAHFAALFRRGGREIRGVWTYSWNLDDTTGSGGAQPFSPPTELKFRQLGSRIWAVPVHPGAAHAIRLRGTLLGRSIVTGT